MNYKNLCKNLIVEIRKQRKLADYYLENAEEVLIINKSLSAYSKKLESEIKELNLELELKKDELHIENLEDANDDLIEKLGAIEEYVKTLEAEVGNDTNTRK